MPHYKDGTEAKIGDLVKGQGYNAKNPDGTAKTIVGTVVEVKAGQNKFGSCTLTVAYFGRPASGSVYSYMPCVIDAAGNPLIVATEYGDTTTFEKVG